MRMNNMNIIGFAGRKRSGKTTLANFLKDEHNAVILTIANYLKYLCCELVNMTYDELNINKDNGYTFDIVPNDRWYKIINKETNIAINDIKKELKNKHITSIRQLLQVIGTDVIRKYNENWHVMKLNEAIESYPENTLIVVDDVRFPNEMKVIAEHSGEVFFIIRPNYLEVSNHSSETSLTWQFFDIKHVIINDRKSSNDFILHFKTHYNNNFNLDIPNSIFLYENKDYLTSANPKFGIDNNESELLRDIVRQITKNDFFYKTGVIRYKTSLKKLSEEYISEVDRHIKYLDWRFNEFVTYNPLITENLKKFL